MGYTSTTPKLSPHFPLVERHLDIQITRNNLNAYIHMQRHFFAGKIKVVKELKLSLCLIS
jgi:hypothetical protein